MIEKDTIVELSNKKKYLLVDYSLENDKLYYLGLELDYETEDPKDDSMFFEFKNTDTLIPVKNDSDINYLKVIFTNKFMNEVVESDK